MNYRELDIQSCYESGTGNIVSDFYEPVLSNAVKYDRIAGFFSSSALAVASEGLYGFIQNGGHMRLITSPILNPADAKVIEKFIYEPDTLTEEELGLKFDTITDTFAEDHVKALGWMLKNNLLEIKLAIVTDKSGRVLSKEELDNSALFHQKVGVLTDTDGNEISFSGSINESATAWVNNDEEFKVFKAWSTESQANVYFARDKERFDEIWENERSNVRVYKLPEAVKQKLIRFSSDFDIESISIKRYKKIKSQAKKFEDCEIPLFYYQADALRKWKNNNYCLLFEMATGTGKTRTAVAALGYLMSKHERLVAVISCPQNTLARQWKENEVEVLGIKADISKIIDGTNRTWVSDLEKMLLKNSVGFANHCIIYTSHNTASSDKFIKAIEENLDGDTRALFIGDEAHWLGAKTYRKALLNRYDFRIGLSATPSRWFDDSGTKLLVDYFGNSNFSFGLRDALTEINPLTGKHFLVDYYYNIYKTSLTDDEACYYAELTEKISVLYRMRETDPSVEDSYTRLLETRADIVKNAESKYEVLKEILDKLIEEGSLENLIIFVSPEQRERVKSILFNKRIPFHQLTQDEGTIPDQQYAGLSERQHIIKCFKNKYYKALVAVKCLDEGIDIPTAERGILMASSTNPREYVQRIGRIIRQSRNKKFAYLYDICIDKVDCLSGESADIERRIKANECRRLLEIAENAINSAEAVERINEMN